MGWGLVWGVVVLAGMTQAEEGTSAERSLSQESEQVKRLERQLRASQESLMLANSESEFYKQQWENLRLRNEALGVDALSADEKRLQDRVVQAVKELYQAERERRDAGQLLQRLMTATQNLLKTAQGIDAERRAEYESVFRTVREFLEGRGASSFPMGRDLRDGQIVSVNPELSAVVINLGVGKGVKAGMPFRVFRESRLIGRIRVLQARESVSAALIESVEKGKELNAGDRVTVATDK